MLQNLQCKHCKSIIIIIKQSILDHVRCPQFRDCKIYFKQNEVNIVRGNYENNKLSMIFDGFPLEFYQVIEFFMLFTHKIK